MDAINNDSINKQNKGVVMNQQTQTEKPNQPKQPEFKDKPLQESQSNIQTKEKSCGSEATDKPLSSQTKGTSTAPKEEGCCCTDKEHDHGNENKINVSTISKDQLLAKIKNNDGVQIVNVLSPEHYGKGFIKGSKKIPLDQLDGRLNELDKTKEVVTYCASSECNASMKAAEKLAAKGFKVNAYEGGIKEWSEAGLPIDK